MPAVTEHLSLLGTALTIIGSLTAMVRYLLKLNWRMKREADKAKDELAVMRIADLKRAIDEHQGHLDSHTKQMTVFEGKIAEFSKRLDANRDSADAAVSSLRAFVAANETRFGQVEVKVKEIETNFGKVTVKP